MLPLVPGPVKPGVTTWMPDLKVIRCSIGVIEIDVMYVTFVPMQADPSYWLTTTCAWPGRWSCDFEEQLTRPETKAISQFMYALPEVGEPNVSTSRLISRYTRLGMISVFPLSTTVTDG